MGRFTPYPRPGTRTQPLLAPVASQMAILVNCVSYRSSKREWGSRRAQLGSWRMNDAAGTRSGHDPQCAFAVLARLHQELERPSLADAAVGHHYPDGGTNHPGGLQGPCPPDVLRGASDRRMFAPRDATRLEAPQHRWSIVVYSGGPRGGASHPGDTWSAPPRRGPHERSPCGTHPYRSDPRAVGAAGRHGAGSAGFARCSTCARPISDQRWSSSQTRRWHPHETGRDQASMRTFSGARQGRGEEPPPDHRAKSAASDVGRMPRTPCSSKPTLAAGGYGTRFRSGKTVTRCCAPAPERGWGRTQGLHSLAGCGR